MTKEEVRALKPGTIVALEPRGELAEVTPYHSIIGVWVMSNGSGLWARFEEIREVVLVPKERSEDK
jgi:hypothetical protein